MGLRATISSKPLTWTGWDFDRPFRERRQSGGDGLALYAKRYPANSWLRFPTGQKFAFNHHTLTWVKNLRDSFEKGDAGISGALIYGRKPNKRNVLGLRPRLANPFAPIFLPPL